MSESENPTQDPIKDFEVSLPDKTEIIDISDSHGGKLVIKILDLQFSLKKLRTSPDTIDLEILKNGETLAETKQCPDWFWKSRSGMGQLRNNVDYSGDDRSIEVEFESALELLPKVYQKIIKSEELNFAISGKKDEIEKIREVLESIVAISTDEETEFRFRLDPDHPDVLSEKRPIAKMSVSAWAFGNPQKFEKVFVDASSGGYHPDLTDEDDNVEAELINKIKEMLENEVQETRPVEERILDDLEDHLNRSLSTIDHLTPLNDAAPGPDYFVGDIESTDGDPIIWIPRNIMLGEHLDDIISGDIHQTMADLEAPAIQRDLFESNKQEIQTESDHGQSQVMRAYPIKSSEINRRPLAIAVLETSGRLDHDDDDDEGGSTEEDGDEEGDS